MRLEYFKIIYFHKKDEFPHVEGFHYFVHRKAEKRSDLWTYEQRFDALHLFRLAKYPERYKTIFSRDIEYMERREKRKERKEK